MNAAQRRDALQKALYESEQPISASSLAAQFGVSRQIIVGDVALLRAEGQPIIATPRGYLVQWRSAQNCSTIACRHPREALLDELYTIVDTGCSVVDVTVEHPVYGQMTGNLAISSRLEADAFWHCLLQNSAAPLCELTGDVHLHNIRYPSEMAFARCLEALQAKGYLLKTDAAQ